ncbi:unnamed protein product, partial [Symbiodinium microadriaticum]
THSKPWWWDPNYFSTTWTTSWTNTSTTITTTYTTTTPDSVKNHNHRVISSRPSDTLQAVAGPEIPATSDVSHSSMGSHCSYNELDKAHHQLVNKMMVTIITILISMALASDASTSVVEAVYQHC